MDNINFFSEDIDFSLKKEDQIAIWLQRIAEAENSSIEEISYVFCSDDYLLKINQEYLDHDYYTDIITFDNRDNPEDPIESDIFISIDRVTENASDQNVSFELELKRVLAHGLLHLIGYNDKTEEEQQLMREKEEAYLSLQIN
ncbi:rRNA maturation RNase YbeY [Roseivirga ehrenbergii]|uniref:Endoribonuclease YbeY n=1 Tax=Roseivirga ehrenbergii (strain DSM 102268 / JCM 13514 / KCTC 12282 / NCIMB 14502 / KMM 6017) TaxID=279360 RepID=A0A150XSA2_ROSEK|nr:rRNA maturation RNase YbeY [Roseivirga ehrenbergii]KYG81627.1 rRNA maturation factor [Roseivirga ehrenbergii]TCL10798.1 rRNA maturation RNase YbeY [Roseivirga ehrenbergii]